ncbi:Excinuclease ABC C subunit domain protein [Chthoniobacter flavus Ellin428]|uniref:Excinuclease ABC C subunit domain protein n=1 Tax=Chthoniobacter flavus Ellin428 TaxID=497964 RepID=B4CUP9_9BACT|nr:GIY-YIG nuclease family protein [Chthoniobacter flavus]EDY22287.1 Excinuclease ABC C subunit domain protein [Chthoniobacter flavus Ellin428]TCO94696.1 GIY-YIG catalytic domain-containing protein [Chthoniobacter flavus]
MAKFTYVYILVSEADPTRYYVGRTDDLEDRLRRHNAGEVSYTSDHRPWKINVAIAFHDRTKAIDFEKYLKTHSGRAFANRHF